MKLKASRKYFECVYTTITRRDELACNCTNENPAKKYSNCPDEP